MSALPDIDSLRKEFQTHVEHAKSRDEVEHVRIQWLGRKGKLTVLLKELGGLSIEEKKVAGPLLNKLKNDLDVTLADQERALGAKERAAALERDTFDITLPGVSKPLGHTHPLTQVMESLVTIFRSLGFVVADGPEIETEFNNFEALNVPADHPARDMQDTFYLDLGQEQLTLPPLRHLQGGQEPNLLRTHTSPVQVRILQAYAPPVAIVCPGRVYRHEAVDATHAATFHQMEGLMVDEGLSFADLKGTLARFAQLFFDPSVKTRFRPSFFPFTEPSAQMDVSCVACHGAGCRICKQTGWIELLGAGMVNPNVFKAVNVDSERYTGFAFGMGIERLAMIRYDIGDMRLFFENDLRFLSQF